MQHETNTILASGDPYRALVECCPDPMCVFRDGTLLFLNHAAVRLLGASEPNDLIGTAILDRVHQASRNMVATRLATVVAGGTAAQWIEMTLLRLDNTAVEIEAAAASCEFAGAPSIVATLHDISSRKRAEHALRDSEERWKFALDGSGDGVWDWNLETGDAVFSAHWMRMLGVAEDALAHRTDAWMSRVHPDDLPEVMATIQTHLDGITASAVVEHRMRTEDGTWKWMLTRGFVVRRDAAAKPLRMVGTNSDITDRKRAEEQQRDSEARFRSWFNLPLAGICITSPTKGWLEVNDHLCDMLGYTRSELDAMTWAELTHPEDLAADSTQFDRVLRGEIEGYSLEKRFVRKDGRTLPTALSVRCVRKSDGSVDYFVALLDDISARTEAVDSLRRNEAEHAAMIANISDVTGIIGIDGVMKYKSPNIERWFGWKPEDLVGTDGWATVHPDDLERIQKEFGLLLAGDGTSRTVEYRYRCKDGSFRPIELTAVDMTKDPLIGGVLMNYHDITARKDTDNLLNARLLDITARAQAEVALREELSSTARLLENTGSLAKVGGWELDVRSMRLHWSLETCRIHEVDPPVTPPLADAINYYTPEARPVIESLVNAALQDGTPYDVELPLVTATGRSIWVRAQCSPVIEDGTVTLLRGAIHDITERKRAEQEREDSHRLLANLARLVPSAIYQYRLYPDGRSAFPYANQGINDIYEVTPEEVQEDATPVFGRLHPEDAERVGQLIMESARTLDEFYCEFRVMLPRQGLRWRWSQAHPERMPDGGTLWHGIISDITERKRAEQEQEKLEAQLAQSQRLESVGLLAGGVAHDFNNMLGVILGTAELAIAQVDAAQPLHTDLMEIRKAAVRSADLTRQLLAFARQQTIAPTALDVNETVDGLLTMLRRLIGEDVRIIWEPSAPLWPVRMDASQVDQILTNLCVNARHAIPGVGTLHIETSNVVADATFCSTHAEAVPGDYVRLLVRDSGSGMDAATLERIFEPFFSTKAVGAGSGLGLAMVHGAVKQNNGFVTVASTPGVGTTFEIFLPRHRGAPTPAQQSAAVVAGLRGGETILVVEDEPALLRLTTKVLTTQGYAVLTATNGADALRLASTHFDEIHLLLSDVVMPEMNGRDLAAALHELRPALKLLFMSGHTAGIIASRGLLETELALIEKPFTPVALAAKVREVLDAG